MLIRRAPCLHLVEDDPVARCERIGTDRHGGQTQRHGPVLPQQPDDLRRRRIGGGRPPLQENTPPARPALRELTTKPPIFMLGAPGLPVPCFLCVATAGSLG